MPTPSENVSKVAAGAAEAKRLAARLRQQRHRSGKLRVDLVLNQQVERAARRLAEKLGLPVGSAIARLIVAADDSKGGICG